MLQFFFKKFKHCCWKLYLFTMFFSVCNTFSYFICGSELSNQKIFILWYSFWRFLVNFSKISLFLLITLTPSFSFRFSCGVTTKIVPQPEKWARLWNRARLSLYFPADLLDARQSLSSPMMKALLINPLAMLWSLVLIGTQGLWQNACPRRRSSKSPRSSLSSR